MAGQRQPTNLVLLKGRKHFTKAELAERIQKETVAPCDAVAPPEYLTKEEQQRFIDLACELVRIDLLSNLDCDALARYVQSEAAYVDLNELAKKKRKQAVKAKDLSVVLPLLEKLENLRDKAFKQCRAAALDLGLTISSRCKLMIPKPKEEREDDPMEGVLGKGRGA